MPRATLREALRNGDPQGSEGQRRCGRDPRGIRELTLAGHRVIVQTEAEGSAIADDDLAAAGATIAAGADEVFDAADMIVKVKEPQPEEYAVPRRTGALHLPPPRRRRGSHEVPGRAAGGRRRLRDRPEPDARPPLLAPMSEIAGRMAPQVGAAALERSHGGRGADGRRVGVAPARVVVLGAGMAGANAAWIAAGMEAEVTVVDRDVDRLEIDRVWHGRIQTVMSSLLAIEQLVIGADLVVGAVLVPGAKAPHLVSAETVGRMRPGPCSSTSRSTRRVFRDVARHHPLRPDVYGGRGGALLRRQYARRGAAHLHLRAHQRDAALRGHDRRPGGGRRRPCRSRRWRAVSTCTR